MSNCSICGIRHPNPSYNPCIAKRDKENYEIVERLKDILQKFELKRLEGDCEKHKNGNEFYCDCNFCTFTPILKSILENK